MMNAPEATNNYYATKAKWKIQSVASGVGKSVDIPKWHYRKVPITIVHYDATPDTADAELSQAILVDRKRVPLDEYVIQKVDIERFMAALYSIEAEYVRCKVVEELPGLDIRAQP
ncbi:MAG: hypothetical protein Q8P24_16635 [Desulfobacterales bacterium]|nr:hypothetical protein [Desulfobacterales bacterium]